MKIRKWKKKKEKKERIYFRMIQEEDSIEVFLCDANGNRIPQGNILSFTSTGIMLNRNVSSCLGLPLDGEGRVKIVDD